MACSIIRHPATRELVAVMAPNGNDSLLYDHFLNKGLLPQEALSEWGVAYTPIFKEWFGDWSQQSMDETQVDLNGEPLPNHVEAFKTAILADSSMMNQLIAQAAPLESIRSVEGILQRFKQVFPGLQTKIVSPDQVKDLIDHPVAASTVNAFIKGKTVYLVEGRVGGDTALEEILHVFTHALEQDRKPLHRGLFNQATFEYPAKWQMIQQTYTPERGFSELDRQSELITQVLKAKVGEGLTLVSQKENLNLWQRLLRWLDGKFKKLGLVDGLRDLPLTASLDDVAILLNTAGVSFELRPVERMMYSLEEEQAAEGITPEQQKEIAYRERLKQRRLERLDEQIDTISHLLGKESPIKSKTLDQRNTLTIIKKNMLEYRSMIESNQDQTVSVTKLMGQVDMDATMSQAYADFGTFMHSIVEELQKESLLTGKLPSQIYADPQWFQQHYNKHGQTFHIDGMGFNEIRDLATELVGKFDRHYQKGNVIIPEMTIYAQGRLGHPQVLGRIDFMVIHTDGSVSIFDLKTTKLVGTKNPSFKLKSKIGFQKASFNEGVDEAFRKIRERSKVIGYYSQVRIYEQMLGQIGIPVRDTNIISLFYRGEEEKGPTKDAPKTFTYTKGFVEDLDWKDYMYEVDEDTGELSKRPVFKQIERAAREAVPVEGQAVEDFNAETAGEESQYQQEFDRLNQAAVERLLDRMRALVNQNIKSVKEEISKATHAQADPAYIRSQEERKNQLYQIVSYLERDNVASVVRLQESINGLIADYQSLHERIDHLKQTEVKGSEESTVAWIKVNDQLSLFKDMFTAMKEMAAEAIAEHNLDSNQSQLMSEMNQVLDKISADQNEYIQRGAQAMIDFIRRENPEALTESLFETIHQIMPGEKLKLEREIATMQELLAGGWSATTNVTAQIKQKLGLTSPQVYQKNLETAIKNAQNRLAYIERKLSDKKSLTDEDIEDYVKGFLTNPESSFYLGSSTGSDLMGLSKDDFYAGRVSPELLISSLSGYLAKMQTQAGEQFYKEMNQVGIDARIERFVNKAGGVSQANALISETISLTHRNADGSRQSNEYRSFVSPWAQSFKEQYDQFRFQLMDLQEQIDELSKAYNQSGRTDEGIRQQRERLLEKHRDLKRNQHDWLRANAEMPYVDEVYELRRDLPQQVQQELDRIEEETRSIMNPYKFNNEEQITEDDLDRLRYLAIERRKLTSEARKMDPNYQTLLEKYNQYFEYDINEGLFARLRAKKHSELVLEKNDPKAFALWEDRNTVKEIRDSYYDEISRIQEEIASIRGEQPDDVRELNKQKNAIVRRYHVNGEFDTSIMDDADIQAWEALDAQISQIIEGRKNAPKPDYSKAEKQRLAQLYAELSDMQTSQLNPYFEREVKAQKARLQDEILAIRKLDARIAQAADPEERADLVEQQNAIKKQYFLKEKEFKAFFDKHHLQPYVEGSLLYGKLEENPRPFHYQKTPADEKYYKRVPGPKYRLRRHTAAAHNPNYHVSAEGYPIPKGLLYDTHNNRYNLQAASTNINPRYVALTQNKEAYDFYNFLVMDQYLARQSRTFGKRLGFLYPGVQEEGTEEFLQDPREAMQRKWHELVDEKVLKESKLEAAANEYGQTGTQRVVFRANYALPADLATKDGITAILNWRMEASINESMGKANLQLTPMKDYLKSILERLPATDSKVRQVQKVLDQFEFEQQKFVYGQNMGDKDLAAGLDDSWLNRRNIKILFRAISFTRLGFDIPLQLGNMVSGNVQAYIASSRIKHASDEDYLWAKYELYKKVFPDMMKDYGKIADVGFYTKFYRYLNPMQKDLNRTLNLATRTKGRRILNRALNFNDMSFVLQDKGELEIGMTTALMIYHGSRFKKLALDANGQPMSDANGDKIYALGDNGEPILVHGMDAFEESADGGIQPKKDVDISKADEQLLKERVYSEIIKVQGNYSSYSSSRAESFMLGRLLLFYRKYIPSMLSQRFGGINSTVEEMIDWRTNDVSMGWYTALFRMFQYYGPKEAMKSLLPGAARKKLGIETPVTDFFLHKKTQAMKEIVAATVAYMLYDMIRDSVLDSDDDDLNWLEMILMRTMVKVTNETRGVVPVPIIGKPEDYVDIFTNFTTATREFKTAFNGAKNLIYAIFGIEDGFYKRDTGYFEQGDAKVWKEIHELFGIDNMYNLYDPSHKLKQSIQAAP